MNYSKIKHFVRKNVCRDCPFIYGDESCKGYACFEALQIVNEGLVLHKAHIGMTDAE